MAGFLDQGAVEGVQAGWLLNFVIFGRNGGALGPLGLPAPPPARGAPAPGGWIPGPGGRRGGPGRLVAQFRDFWVACQGCGPRGAPCPWWIPGPGGRRSLGPSRVEVTTRRFSNLNGCSGDDLVFRARILGPSRVEVTTKRFSNLNTCFRASSGLGDDDLKCVLG